MFIKSPSPSYDPLKDFPYLQPSQTKQFGEQFYNVVRLGIEDNNRYIVFVQAIEQSEKILGTYWTTYGGPVGEFKTLQQEEIFYKTLVDMCENSFLVRTQREPVSKYIHVRKVKLLDGTYAYDIVLTWWKYIIFRLLNLHIIHRAINLMTNAFRKVMMTIREYV